MNVPPEGIGPYLDALGAAEGGAGLVVAPPYVYLERVASRAPRNVGIGAQNCGDQKSGAFTGEVSAAMLRDCGAAYVIVGHSERRGLYGEVDSLVARKLALAIEAGLRPVPCIGEDQRVREAGLDAVFVADQLKAPAIPELAGATEVVIAYETVPAIGPGRNAAGAWPASGRWPEKPGCGRGSASARTSACAGLAARRFSSPINSRPRPSPNWKERPKWSSPTSRCGPSGRGAMRPGRSARTWSRRSGRRWRATGRSATRR